MTLWVFRASACCQVSEIGVKATELAGRVGNLGLEKKDEPISDSFPILLCIRLTNSCSPLVPAYGSFSLSDGRKEERANDSGFEQVCKSHQFLQFLHAFAYVETLELLCRS